MSTWADSEWNWYWDDYEERNRDEPEKTPRRKRRKQKDEKVDDQTGTLSPMRCQGTCGSNRCPICR